MTPKQLLKAQPDRFIAVEQCPFCRATLLPDGSYIPAPD